MRILCIDVGTGTQDILLFDSNLNLENAYKLVLPSATMVIRQRIQDATRRRSALLLSGVTMGGGPCAWAAEDHLRANLPVFITPDAARTFNDDLAEVEKMGVRIVSEDEARHLPDSIERIPMADLQFEAIRTALDQFGVGLNKLDGLAVAVFDHGAAPPGISDRKFRFEYLDERIRAENRLSAFAYPAYKIPARMTRLQAVAYSAVPYGIPLVVMDTAPAAVLGATYDPEVRPEQREIIIVNVGNFHTLAFQLGPAGLGGVFEHHTGFLDRSRLEDYLLKMADGSLSGEQVFDDMGHGALIYANKSGIKMPEENRLVVTGPRRGLLTGSHLQPYFAVPFGDMMLSGCFGLLSAAADCFPEWKEPISASLRSSPGAGKAPWDAVA